MASEVLGTRHIVQIGLIVRDVEQATERYAELFGIEKPQIIVSDGYDKAHTQYNGEPTEARAKLAFLDMGPVQLELIEPDEHPSTWRSFLDSKGPGIHHVAFRVNDIPGKAESLTQAGLSVEQTGDYTGGRYAYIDSRERLGTLIELLESVEA